jgi:hypothetical protein
MYNYTDRRIIINSRQPRENEFILHKQVTMSHEWMMDLLNYIESNSNLTIEWIEAEHFVTPDMIGFRLIKRKEE